METPLVGKVVVVIGGTSGLGLSGVRACLAAGARVLALGLPESVSEDLARALGPSARLLDRETRGLGIAAVAPDDPCGGAQLAGEVRGHRLGEAERHDSCSRG